jgi:DNA-binding transcriptional LysR family regulator
MDIRQLQVFIAAFEERSITQAARRLHLSQPTLSVTIRQLEDTLGTTLFVRKPRGVDVSEEARLLYPQARRLIDQSNSIEILFRHKTDSLPLTIGVEGDLARTQLETFLRHAHQAQPSLQLTLLSGCAGDVRLAAEEYRCEDDLFLPLWEDSFVLVLPAGDRLLHYASLGAEQLGGANWITCPSHSSHQRLIALYGEGDSRLGAASCAGDVYVLVCREQAADIRIDRHSGFTGAVRAQEWR